MSRTMSESNGTINRIRSEVAPKRARKPATVGTSDVKPAPDRDPLMRWAYAGILLAVTMSAGLNGYCNAQHAAVPWAGWVLGILVPALVLVLARLAGGSWARGWRALAYFSGAVGVALLALSVSHCAKAFAELTGADLVSAYLMAVGIDCGLVACELMTIGRKGK
jgi:hypothetical protein